ncbi:hypothetical protein ACLX1H_007353 [Fusarium chlamydosporum]
MFTYRGRGGPSRSTPANVQSTAQERPYVSRPSRSQQLRNPKLVPKLTNDTLNPLEKKEGVADAELAKANAERARKREREERDDELINSTVKRHRSVSSHSVSTISTGASRSPSPGKDGAGSPHARGRSPYSDHSRGRGRDGIRSRNHSFSSNRSRSPRVESKRRRSVSDDDRSPEDGDRRNRYRSRDPLPSGRESAPTKQSKRSLSGSRSPGGYRAQRAEGSRSPEHRVRRDERPDRADTRHDRDRPAPRGGFDERRNGRGGRHQENVRERSLSPFSQRLAMTKAMKQGGR